MLIFHIKDATVYESYVDFAFVTPFPLGIAYIKFSSEDIISENGPKNWRKNLRK